MAEFQTFQVNKIPMMDFQNSRIIVSIYIQFGTLFDANAGNSSSGQSSCIAGVSCLLPGYVHSHRDNLNLKTLTVCI